MYVLIFYEKKYIRCFGIAHPLACSWLACHLLASDTQESPGMGALPSDFHSKLGFSAANGFTSEGTAQPHSVL